MERQFFKTLAAGLLAAVLLVGLVPVTVRAAEPTLTITRDDSVPGEVRLSTANNVILTGTYTMAWTNYTLDPAHINQIDARRWTSAPETTNWLPTREPDVVEFLVGNSWGDNPAGATAMRVTMTYIITPAYAASLTTPVTIEYDIVPFATRPLASITGSGQMVVNPAPAEGTPIIRRLPGGTGSSIRLNAGTATDIVRIYEIDLNGATLAPAELHEAGISWIDGAGNLLPQGVDNDRTDWVSGTTVTDEVRFYEGTTYLGGQAILATRANDVTRCTAQRTIEVPVGIMPPGNLVGNYLLGYRATPFSTGTHAALSIDGFIEVLRPFSPVGVHRAQTALTALVNESALENAGTVTVDLNPIVLTWERPLYRPDIEQVRWVLQQLGNRVDTRINGIETALADNATISWGPAETVAPDSVVVVETGLNQITITGLTAEIPNVPAGDVTVTLEMVGILPGVEPIVATVNFAEAPIPQTGIPGVTGFAVAGMSFAIAAGALWFVLLRRKVSKQEN